MNKVLPYGTGKSKREEVEEMFDEISPRYDFLNRFLSLGIDIYWRKKAVHQLKKRISINPRLLDVATGTADLALACLKLKPKEIIGLDISKNMLDFGRKKLLKKNIRNIRLIHSDILDFTDDEGFDGITVAFGVRNFEDPLLGLKKMYDLLKPNGVLMVLEFSIPQNTFFRAIYQFYFNRILPLWGKLFSGNPRAYMYLPESVNAFPYGEKFTKLMMQSGFNQTEFIPLTGGIATLYFGKKIV
jgi:demethylmenaquinone methyltransferase/2-methoxy-6-polyprenyl-1,4-benzoquinol methylase